MSICLDQTKMWVIDFILCYSRFETVLISLTLQDAEAERIKEERLKAYAEKKSKKPTVIAKSSIVLDVKPWDDETDMKAMEKEVRTIEMPGLVWGACKYISYNDAYSEN